MLTPAELVWLIAAVAKGDEVAFEPLSRLGGTFLQRDARCEREAER
jgi:hypothetical protein